MAGGWLTVVDGADEQLAAAAPPSPSAAAFAIDPVTPIEQYLAAVTAARDAVRAGDLVKAVIAREIAVTSDRPDRPPRRPPAAASLVRLQLPLCRRRADRCLAGVARRGRRPRGAGPPARRDGAAHRRSGAATPTSPRRSSTARRTRSSTASSSTSSTTRCCRGAASSTGSRTRRSSPSPTCSTSAPASRACCRRRRRTCSTSSGRCRPRRRSAGTRGNAAMDLIAAVEGVDRGRYAGAVGWVDAAGDGTWAVTLRCAELRPTGAGPGSSPVAASSPTATRSPSSPRRRPSSRPCSPP